jgi:glutamate/tyrosine decarboxylase-like PLP-dependent enzyme
MLQAPYGTGLFLARKGLMEAVRTEEAEYVPGKDCTLCGSRSGANAIAVWMILQTYGSAGGEAFIGELLRRTDHLCAGLRALEVPFYRHPSMNVVALRAGEVPPEVAHEYHLVPDTHDSEPAWWKIVVMDHVRVPVIEEFLGALGEARRGGDADGRRRSPDAA